MRPLVKVRSEGSEPGTRHVDVFSRLVEDRIIFLHEELDGEVASNLIATLFYLDKQNSKEDITIYINSIGGDIDAMFGIYDAFQTIAAPIKTIAVGKAYSAAAVLLASGSPGKRFVYPNAQVMIHHIQVSEMEGSKKELEEQVSRLDAENRTLVEILARHTGHPVSVIDEDCQYDKYFTALEAVEYGIVDSVHEYAKKLPKIRKRRKSK